MEGGGYLNPRIASQETETLVSPVSDLSLAEDTAKSNFESQPVIFLSFFFFK